MIKFLRSIRKSLAEAFRGNEYIVKWLEHYPRTFKFLGRRLARGQPYGLSFTFWLGLGFIILLWFISWVGDVTSNTPIVAVDIRLMNLLFDLRNIAVAKALLIFTYLGNWQIVISLGIIFVVWLWLVGERYRAVLLVLATSVAEIVYFIIKIIVQRPRPEIDFALIPQGGYAFPSGHATIAMAFYGLVGYFLYSRLRQRWHKIIILLVSFAIIFLIGFSRLYLGVHWSSDVFSGWALGFIILIIFISIFDYRGLRRYRPVGSKRSRIMLIVPLLILEIIFLGAFYYFNPLIEPAATHTATVKVRVEPANLEQTVLGSDFPKYSETLSGQNMEPISFIVIGSKEKLLQIFSAAGWLIADKPQIKTWDELAKAAIWNRPYPTAPVTPAFLKAVPNQLAFIKGTEANTVRQRHHTRYWQTDFVLQDKPIWVATASFDDGMRYLVTHKIRPEIDIEREFIMKDLLATGLVAETKELQLVMPQLGQNQSQDIFFTDGKAYLIFLK